MPVITVTVDDPRHSEHDACVAFMDESGIADWDDFLDMYGPEEVEVDFDEWLENRG